MPCREFLLAFAESLTPNIVSLSGGIRSLRAFLLAWPAQREVLGELLRRWEAREADLDWLHQWCIRGCICGEGCR